MITENILFKYVHSSPQPPYTHIYTSDNVAISVRFIWQENSPDKKVKSKAIPWHWYTTQLSRLANQSHNDAWTPSSMKHRGLLS